MFSNGFSEGEIRDINEGFPTDKTPYTDSYDYSSDSDLEDDELESPHGGRNPDPVAPAEALEKAQSVSEAEAHKMSALSFIQPLNLTY